MALTHMHFFGIIWREDSVATTLVTKLVIILSSYIPSIITVLFVFPLSVPHLTFLLNLENRTKNKLIKKSF
jgi:hypothetical protein